MTSTHVKQATVTVDGVVWQDWPGGATVEEVFQGMFCHLPRDPLNIPVKCETVALTDVSHSPQRGTAPVWEEPRWWWDTEGWEEEWDYISNLADAMRRGDAFPPVVVVRMGGRLWWDDGAHRMTAAGALLGISHVRAWVIDVDAAHITD